MSFTINGTTLEQTASPATLSDLVGMTNVVSTANNTIVDTSAYTDVKITGDFLLEGTLIVDTFTIANAACNVYVGTNAAGDTLKPGYLAVVKSSSTAISPRNLNFDFVFKNSTLDFVGGGRGGYYDGGYVYDLDGCVVVGNGAGAIGIRAGSVLKNTTYINMNDLSFFGSPADTTGFVIDGSTNWGAFIDSFSGVVELLKFSSPRYVVQRRGKFALTDCKIAEFIACRHQPVINQTFFTFLRTIKTAGIGANANASTTRYVYDAGGSVLSQAPLSANGELSEAIQWGKVHAYDLGASSNMNSLARKMTPAMINTNTGTYQHMTGEYKLPLSVSHVSYLGELLTSNNINFDVSSDEILTDFTLAPNLLDDPNITELNKAVTDAYTSLGTPQKLYDRGKSHLVDNYAGELSTLVTRSGNLIDAGAYNVTIDATASSVFSVSGNTITIKASTFTGDMTTTGVITLSNGAIFSGTRTDANGTVSPPRIISVTGIVAGSRLRIYNSTTSTEVYNAIVSGTSYTASYAEGTGYSQNDVLEVRVAEISKLEFSSTVAASATGWSLLVTQEANATYASYGVDGSTVAGITWDGGNMEFDFNDADNHVAGGDIAAWYFYFITTATGIAEAFGAISWPQINRVSNRTATLAITFDNKKADPLKITGAWIDRDDGATVIASASNSIQIDPPAVFIKETGISGLTPAESAKLDLISTVDGKVDTIDTVVDAISANVTTLDGKVDTIDTVVDVISANVTTVDGKVDQVKNNTALIPALL